MELAIVVAVVVVALAFDYTNGFHDAANAIATSVSTRALTPRIALVMAAVMNFVGAFLGQKVANTIRDVIVPGGTASHGLVVVMAGLLGAIAWNLITWYFGLPSSSSHALIGGLVGAALASGSVVHWSVIVDKVVIPMVLSPLVGFGLAFALMVAIMWLFRRRNPHRTQPRVPSGADRVGGGHGTGARAAGRPEDDGRDLPGTAHRRLRAQRRPAADLGDLFCRHGDLARHLLRRLADHAHPRPSDHPPRPRARLRVGVGGCGHPLHDGVRLPGAGVHHARDHLGHHGCRRDEAALGGAVGDGAVDPDGLGPPLPSVLLPCFSPPTHPPSSPPGGKEGGGGKPPPGSHIFPPTQREGPPQPKTTPGEAQPNRPEM